MAAQSPPPAAHELDRATAQYWRFMEQLKAASLYTSLYRDQLYSWVRAVELIKAIAGNGAIAAWAVFQHYPLVWAAIIAAAQLLDAIKGVFPFAALHKQAANLAAALDLLALDAEDQWRKTPTGPAEAETLTAALLRLRRLQLETEQKFFPDGTSRTARLNTLALAQAKAYFEQAYPVERPDD